jgi:hypothetical protein
MLLLLHQLLELSNESPIGRLCHAKAGNCPMQPAPSTTSKPQCPAGATCCTHGGELMKCRHNNGVCCAGGSCCRSGYQCMIENGKTMCSKPVVEKSEKEEEPEEEKEEEEPKKEEAPKKEESKAEPKPEPQTTAPAPETPVAPTAAKGSGAVIANSNKIIDIKRRAKVPPPAALPGRSRQETVDPKDPRPHRVDEEEDDIEHEEHHDEEEEEEEPEQEKQAAPKPQPIHHIHNKNVLMHNSVGSPDMINDDPAHEAAAGAHGGHLHNKNVLLHNSRLHHGGNNDNGHGEEIIEEHIEEEEHHHHD